METTPSSSSSQAVHIHKLCPEETVEHQHLHLFYNCDDTYSKGHKCKENKLFQMDVSPHDYLKDILVEETLEPTLEDTTPPLKDESPMQSPYVEPQISLHARSSFSTPQTLKLISYIKHHKVIELIENDNAPNFIHKRVAIGMGDYEIVLEEKLLCTLGHVTIDFKEFTQATQEGKKMYPQGAYI